MATYDIFINHSGGDVESKFVSHLCHRLLPHGLRLLMGKEESVGEYINTQTKNNILGASLHIAILCDRYKDSKRRLKELQIMLQSRLERESTIIPVFYNVKPTDIRWAHGYGVYAPNPKKLEDKEKHGNMGKWINVFHEVTAINGFALEHCNGDEGMLVDQVVKRVLKVLENRLDYDVFINHRGLDVKKTLASHLYYCLVAKGLRVFLDCEEMQEGESLTYQIKRAIETSFVHIAIFSPKYAESEWCLEELVQMLESCSTIIPVFHHVKRSDLTSGDGLYAQGLRKLQEKIDQGKLRYESTTIEKWKTALSSVLDIPTTIFDLENCDGDEGQLADDVMEKVLSVQIKAWEDGVRPRYPYK